MRNSYHRDKVLLSLIGKCNVKPVLSDAETLAVENIPPLSVMVEHRIGSVSFALTTVCFHQAQLTALRIIMVLDLTEYPVIPNLP